MLSPPCQNMGGYITPIPPGIYALDHHHHNHHNHHHHQHINNNNNNNDNNNNNNNESSRPMWSNIKIVQLDITIVIDIYWLKLLTRHRYKHYFITLLDLLSYCIIMYQRANVCQCLQFIAVLIKAYYQHL